MNNLKLITTSLLAVAVLAGGSYVVTVTGPDSKTPAFTPVPIAVINSGVYTAIVRDAPGGGAPFSVITLHDI